MVCDGGQSKAKYEQNCVVSKTENFKSDKNRSGASSVDDHTFDMLRSSAGQPLEGIEPWNFLL